MTAWRTIGRRLWALDVTLTGAGGTVDLHVATNGFRSTPPEHRYYAARMLAVPAIRRSRVDGQQIRGPSSADRVSVTLANADHGLDWVLKGGYLDGSGAPAGPTVAVLRQGEPDQPVSTWSRMPYRVRTVRESDDGRTVDLELESLDAALDRPVVDQVYAAFGGCLSCNLGSHDQGVTIPDHPELHASSNLLFDAYAFMPSAPFGTMPIAVYPGSWALSRNSSGVHFAIGGTVVTIPTSSYSLGRWYRISAQWTGAHALIFLDGELIDSEVRSAPPPPPSPSLRLCRDGTNMAKIQLCDVRLLVDGEAPVTQQWIKENKDRRIELGTDGLRAYWLCDQEWPATQLDDALESHPGTLVNPDPGLPEHRIFQPSYTGTVPGQRLPGAFGRVLHRSVIMIGGKRGQYHYRDSADVEGVWEGGAKLIPAFDILEGVQIPPALSTGGAQIILDTPHPEILALAKGQPIEIDYIGSGLNAGTWTLAAEPSTDRVLQIVEDLTPETALIFLRTPWGSEDYRNLDRSQIELGALPTLPLTVRVRGDDHPTNGWARTVPDLLQRMLDLAGVAYNEAAIDDLRLAGYDLEAQVSIDDAVTYRQVIDQLAQSIGATWGTDSEGLPEFRLLRKPDPAFPSVVSLDRSNVFQLRKVAQVASPAFLALRYARNAFVLSLDQVAGTVLDDESPAGVAWRSFLTQEWRTIPHPLALAGEVLELDTNLTTADAAGRITAELADFYGSGYQIFAAEVPLDAWSLPLHSGHVTVKNPRFVVLASPAVGLILSVGVEGRRSVLHIAVWPEV